MKLIRRLESPVMQSSRRIGPGFPVFVLSRHGPGIVWAVTSAVSGEQSLLWKKLG